MIQLSIIIPVLNESASIHKNLQYLRTITSSITTELIVVDGGSTDNTMALSETDADKVIQTEKGRSIQMNTGAQQASGQFLLFLHADTRLPNQGFPFLLQVEGWGFYPVRLSGQSWVYRMIETLINLRSKWTSVATGDQCLFVEKDLFDRLGGFANIPLMEDVDMSKRLRQQGAPHIASCSVETSSRKWEQEGVIKTILLMWHLRFLYFIGVSPSYLVKKYYQK
jgi:rSAM/selenodomain-associated transferase 2